MTTSGRLIRGPTGRLARDEAGQLKRCGCPCSTTGDCALVIGAHPCEEVLDEDCERLIDYLKWICTDATCSGTGNPVGTEGGQVIKIGDHCYKTDGSLVRAASSLTEGEQAGVVGGEVLCIAAGCGDPLCAEEEGADVCGCVCSSGDPDDGDFCCIGKLGPNISPPGVRHVCFDWTVSGYEEVEITRTKKRDGPSGCPSNISRGCQAGEGCKVFRREFGIVPPDVAEDICQHSVYCCVNHFPRSRTTLDRRCSTIDTCGLLVNPWACDCPNTADGLWASGWSSLTGLFAEAPADESVQQCTPQNLGSTTTEISLVDPTFFDGCRSEIKRTIVENYTCDSITFDVVTEEWAYWFDTCTDEEDDPFSCCLCQLYYKTTLHLKYEFSAPNSGDLECGQCAAQLTD